MIGQTIRVKNYPFLVVGVLPREFHSLDIERAPDIRVPISAAPVFTGRSATDGGVNYPLGFSILTRLASGSWEESSNCYCIRWTTLSSRRAARP